MNKITITLCTMCLDNLTMGDEVMEHYAHHILEQHGLTIDTETARKTAMSHTECDSCNWWMESEPGTELYDVDAVELDINGTKYDPVHLCYSCNLYAHHGDDALNVIADWIDVDPEYLDDALEEYTEVFTENATGLLPSPHTPLDDAAGTEECHTCKTTKYGFRYLWMAPRT